MVSSMDIMSLVSLLSDGQFHSGSDLGRVLGVSRSAVWKSLGRLSLYGLAVESVKGKGYRLLGALDLLDQSIVCSKLSSELESHVSIDILPQVESTNSVMAERMPSRVSTYSVLLAEMQTKGRGRRGRSWVSPFGKNIYMSLGFELVGGPECLAGLSLVAGLSVARAINGLSGAHAQLKWPNDVLVEGRKAAGILVELQGQATTGWRVVLGVGLNVSMSVQEGESIDQPWVAVGNYMDCTRSELAGAMTNCLVEDLELFRMHGFAHFLPMWRDLDVFLGREIQVIGSQVRGVSEGVDVVGNLLIRVGEELVVINAGEVSVRRHEA